MGQMFSSLADAETWLRERGWLNAKGTYQWFKDRRKATINPSPRGDGVVFVVFKGVAR